MVQQKTFKTRPVRNHGVDADRLSRPDCAVKSLLGRTKLEGTVRYLGIEVEDALELAEHTEV